MDNVDKGGVALFFAKRLRSISIAPGRFSRRLMRGARFIDAFIA